MELINFALIPLELMIAAWKIREAICHSIDFPFTGE